VDIKELRIILLMIITVGLSSCKEIKSDIALAATEETKTIGPEEIWDWDSGQNCSGTTTVEECNDEE
jgi:hypothetical protein